MGNASWEEVKELEFFATGETGMVGAYRSRWFECPAPAEIVVSTPSVSTLTHTCPVVLGTLPPPRYCPWFFHVSCSWSLALVPGLWDAARWLCPGCAGVGMALHTDRAHPGGRAMDTAVDVTQTSSSGSDMDTVNCNRRGRGQGPVRRVQLQRK